MSPTAAHSPAKALALLVLLAVFAIPSFGQGAVFMGLPMPKTGTPPIWQFYLGLGMPPTGQAPQGDGSFFGVWTFADGVFVVQSHDGNVKFTGTFDRAPILTPIDSKCGTVSGTLSGKLKTTSYGKPHWFNHSRAAYSQELCGISSLGFSVNWAGGGSLTVTPVQQERKR